MKLLYDTGVTPLINKHYGYTFQPGRYGQVAMRAQPEARTRYPRQFTRMQHQAQTRRAWAGLSAGEISNWDTFAATYLQACKNPDSGFLTGYQNFLKRQYYQFLNYSPTGDIITNPGLTEIFIDPCTYTIRSTGGKLFIDYEFTNWLNDNIVSLYCSYPKSAGRLYQKTQTRYMGFITNNPARVPNFGFLYNGYALRQSGPNSITSSDDWHVITRPEWTYFYSGSYTPPVSIYYGLGAFKDTSSSFWNSPNTGAMNLGNFSFRGSGARDYFGTFFNFKTWTAYSYGAGGEGDEIYFTNISADGRSGTNASYNHGNVVRFCRFNPGKPFGQMGQYVGNDGQSYTTMIIGELEFMLENLIETKYRNLNNIPNLTDSSAWSATSSGAFCSYLNDNSNAFTYDLGPQSLNITELYKYNFGLIPQPGKHLLFKAVPMAINNGQFFEKTLDLYEIQ